MFVLVEGGKGTIFLFREKVATVIKYSRLGFSLSFVTVLEINKIRMWRLFFKCFLVCADQ